MVFISAAPLSQFRLESERDWEVDGTPEGSAPGPGPDREEAWGGGYLAVDVAQLARALQCVPLHVRLGLEPAVFTVSASSLDAIFRPCETKSGRPNGVMYVSSLSSCRTHPPTPSTG